MRRSHTTIVSRWFVMPIAATVSPSSASARRRPRASVSSVTAPDVVGVVLDPARLREVLRELAVRPTRAAGPSPSTANDAHAGRAGVDRDDRDHLRVPACRWAGAGPAGPGRSCTGFAVRVPVARVPLAPPGPGVAGGRGCAARARSVGPARCAPCRSATAGAPRPAPASAGRVAFRCRPRRGRPTAQRDTRRRGRRVKNPVDHSIKRRSVTTAWSTCPGRDQPAATVRPPTPTPSRPRRGTRRAPCGPRGRGVCAVLRAPLGGGSGPGARSPRRPSRRCTPRQPAKWCVRGSDAGQDRTANDRGGSMRIGMLTGGGDCPGLNAVIRAIVRKGEGEYGHNIVGYRHGWRGVMKGESIDLTLDSVRGLLPRGGTILGTSRTNPFKTDDGLATGEGDARERQDRCAHRDRWRRHPRCRAPVVAGRCARRRRAEDDRQRPLGYRLHLRIPHRGADRDRRHRPAAHDGREPRPCDDRRGDGPARGLDRDLLRDGRRRRRDPRSRRRRSTSTRCAGGSRTATAAAPTSRSSSSPRVRRRRTARWSCRSGEVDDFGHVRLGGIAQPLAGRDRAAHGFRGAHDRARSRAARRQPDRVRPRDRDPLRRRGDRRGARGRRSA